MLNFWTFRSTFRPWHGSKLHNTSGLIPQIHVIVKIVLVSQMDSQCKRQNNTTIEEDLYLAIDSTKFITTAVLPDDPTRIRSQIISAVSRWIYRARRIMRRMRAACTSSYPGTPW